MVYKIKDQYQTDYRRYDSDDLEHPFEEQDELVSQLWSEILLRFSSWSVISVFNKNEIKALFFNVIRQFTAILDETYDRYSTILNYYDREKKLLMTRLGSSSVTTNTNVNERRFNDTPQTGSDGIESDDYLTDYTRTNDKTTHKSEQSYDPTTIMNRLNEITALYRNVLRDWVNEFSGLFWPTGEIVS